MVGLSAKSVYTKPQYFVAMLQKGFEPHFKGLEIIKSRDISWTAKTICNGLGIVRISADQAPFSHGRLLQEVTERR